MKNLAHLNFSKYDIDESGNIYSHFTKKMLKHYKSVDKAGGYYVVSLVNDEGKIKVSKVHRMVVLAFLEPIEGKPQVNHIDGNKSNNHISNLECVNASMNTQHAMDNMLRDPRKSNPNIILPLQSEIVLEDVSKGKAVTCDEDAHEICRLLEKGYRMSDVSKMTGFNLQFVKRLKISDIKKYEHITKSYDFSKLSSFKQTDRETIENICKLIQQGKTNYAIGDELSVCRKVVERIKNRKSYKEISKNYTW